jgi:hypothetical protein
MVLVRPARATEAGTTVPLSADLQLTAGISAALGRYVRPMLARVRTLAAIPAGYRVCDLACVPIDYLRGRQEGSGEMDDSR